MTRSKTLHNSLSPNQFAGAVKLYAEARNVTLADVAKAVGIKPDTLRARLSISRGKRSLQPAQVSAIAQVLSVSESDLHRLAAQHEGWKV